MLNFNVTIIYRILHVSSVVLIGGSHLRPYLTGKKEKRKKRKKGRNQNRKNQKDGENPTSNEHSLM